jgi:hypothetical protein
MFNVLLSNLSVIGILVCMYLGSFVINTFLGLYHNIGNIKETFSKEKLLSGLYKGCIILFGALFLTVIISLLPEVLSIFGLAAESAMIENISVAAMGGVLASAIVKYLSDAVKKLYTIMGSKEENI